MYFCIRTLAVFVLQKFIFFFKRGKLREYSKQFILWCKLISLPSDPKKINHAAWNGDILHWSGWDMFYMLLRITETCNRAWIRFRIFLSFILLLKTDLWFQNKIILKLLNYFDKFIGYYLIKIHFGVIFHFTVCMC